MSRLAKKPIKLLDKTTAVVANRVVTITGPLGSLSRPVDRNVSVEVVDGSIVVGQTKAENAGAMLGTTASHIRNMVAGVAKAYEKKLVIEGIGYKAEVKGENLHLALGFSHPVVVSIPKDLKVTVVKNEIVISGINKDSVGQFSASIRALKKPEPYKGKGIMYSGEKIRRKQGKKAV